MASSYHMVNILSISRRRPDSYLATVPDEPSGRLNAERHTDEQKNSRDHLHGNGNHPPFPALLVRIGSTHAGTPNTSQMHEDLDIAGEEPSKRGRGEFGLVSGNKRFDDTDC